MFKTFIGKIEKEIVDNQNLNMLVPNLRNHLLDYLQNKSFIQECILMSISSLEDCSNKDRWVSPPIYHNPGLNIAVRLFPWPGFYSNNPHKHKTWGVTGVFYNKLEINTYTLPDELQKVPIHNKIIAASQSEAGYIMPECIHSVGNPSANTSISFHIFNIQPDARTLEENAIWYPSPIKANLRDGFITRTLNSYVDCLMDCDLHTCTDTINKIFNIGGLDVKFHLIKNLYMRSPELANKYYRTLFIEC